MWQFLFASSLIWRAPSASLTHTQVWMQVGTVIIWLTLNFAKHTQTSVLQIRTRSLFALWQLQNGPEGYCQSSPKHAHLLLMFTRFPWTELPVTAVGRHFVFQSGSCSTPAPGLDLGKESECLICQHMGRGAALCCRSLWSLPTACFRETYKSKLKRRIHPNNQPSVVSSFPIQVSSPEYKPNGYKLTLPYSTCSIQVFNPISSLFVFLHPFLWNHFHSFLFSSLFLSRS